MREERIHALLPWYANGTLEPDETEAFTRHLETCPACRQEIETVETMRAEIARHGDAFFGEHPAPEVLGALFGIGETTLTPADEEAVRRHLAVCATCTEESRWLTGAETATGAGDAPSPGGADARGRDASSTARGGLHWLERRLVARLALPAAAAAIVVLATVLLPGPWRGGAGPGSVARGILDPTSRGAIAEILLRPEDRAVVLYLRSELTSAQVPARIEILDRESRNVVHRAEGLSPTGAEAIVTVDVPRASLPPGDYVAQLRGATAGELPTEFSFRIVAAAP